LELVVELKSSCLTKYRFLQLFKRWQETGCQSWVEFVNEKNCSDCILSDNYCTKHENERWDLAAHFNCQPALAHKWAHIFAPSA
jgi:hypothetical protein